MPSHESSVDIDGQDSATHESPGGARSSARRHQVSAACLACQKRKSKCDGIKPLCATCVKRNTTCLYLEYGRSRADMRRTIESLNVENNNFRLFVQELREAPDEQVADIIERLRTDRKPLNNPELHEIAAQSVSGVRAAQSGNSAVTKRDVGRQQVKEVGSEEMLLGNLLLNLQSTNLPETSLRPQPSALASPVSSLSPATMLLSNLELEYRKDSGAGLRSDGTSPQSSVEDWIRGGQSSLRPLILKQIAAGFGSLSPQIDGIDGINGTDVVRWTQVTSDADAIGHLLDIYFTWHHPLMQAFSEVSFRQDMQQGHTKHCSRILVNAILALACTLMDASGSEHNVYSANKFMEEASTLYARNAQPCMTTAIALALMALFESVQYQRKAAWDYAQDAAQMALQLSLHMKTTYMHGPSAEDGNTGSLALWAVFQADLLTSSSIGVRPRMASTLAASPMPRMNRREDSVEWPARPDSAPGVHPKPGKMGICAVTRSELLCIINGQPDPDTLSTSPERQKLVSLLYNQYHRWFLNLPADLSSIDLAPAHVLALHMFYHASVINLHKTMLPDKAFLASSGPGQICIEAATSISHLLSAHRKQYNVHGINVFVVQALYEACTIHVRHRGGPLNQESDTFIHDVLSTFRELEFFQPWATRVLVDIMALVNDRLSKSESSRSSSDVASRNERYLPLPHATVRIWEPAAKLTSSDAPHSDLSSSEPPMKRPKFVREYFFNANPG